MSVYYVQMQQVQPDITTIPETPPSEVKVYIIWYDYVGVTPLIIVINSHAGHTYKGEACAHILGTYTI